MSIQKCIHATNICGLSELYLQNNQYEYLCCSSIGCPDYFHRDILILVEGNVIRYYSGDIGCIGFSPKKTDYDELHLEGQFDILGLYIPSNMQNFDLYNYAIAKSYIEDILQLPCIVHNATTEQLQTIQQHCDTISDMTQLEYASLFESYGIEIAE